MAMFMGAAIPYLPVGSCIYCGATQPTPGFSRFGDEHIVPFAFGGKLLLPEASCRTCERIINKQIETPVLRQEWGPLRDKMGWPTRDRPGRLKRTHARIRRKDGSSNKITLGS